MAPKLPQNHGKRSAFVGRFNRGTLLRYLLAFLACLERAAGPAGPTAALPQISPMEPITTPFPRAQRRSLGPSSPAQRSAATQYGRRVQWHRAHHPAKDQSRFPRWGSSSARDPALAQTPRGFRVALFRVSVAGKRASMFSQSKDPVSLSPHFFLGAEPRFELFERRDVGVGPQPKRKQSRLGRPPKLNSLDGSQ
jgi:hypothetical protein